MRFLEGEAGKWFVRELAPPFVLILLIVPALAWLKAPPDSWGKATLHAFGEGDLLAVSFCSLMAAAPLLARQVPHSKGTPESFAPEFQMQLTGVILFFGYIAVKAKPMGADAVIGTVYSILSVLLAALAVTIIYRLRVRAE